MNDFIEETEKQWSETLLEYFETFPKRAIFLGENIEKLTSHFQDELIQSYKELNKPKLSEDSDEDILYAKATFADIISWCLQMLAKLYESQPDDSLADAHKIAVAKHHDYGSGPILNFGVIGVLIRTSDKISKVEQLLDRYHEVRVAESMKDTLLDIINYSTYALILIDDRWISFY